MLKCKCTYVGQDYAFFESQHKEWPCTFRVEFNVEDLSEDEFLSLIDSMKAYDSHARVPTEEQRALVIKADALGYVYRRSYTQVHWTEMGRIRYRKSHQRN